MKPDKWGSVVEESRIEVRMDDEMLSTLERHANQMRTRASIMREAIDLIAMQEEGLLRFTAKPPASTNLGTRINIALPTLLLQKLRKIAAARSTDMSSLMREGIALFDAVQKEIA